MGGELAYHWEVLLSGRAKEDASLIQHLRRQLLVLGVLILEEKRLHCSRYSYSDGVIILQANANSAEVADLAVCSDFDSAGAWNERIRQAEPELAEVET